MQRTIAIAATMFLLAGTVAAQTAPPDSARSAPLARDTPRTTTDGNTFMAPKDWTVDVRGRATVLEPPERGSAIALVDVRAPSADSAVALAWKTYKPDAAWPLKVVNGLADKDGWTDRRAYTYQTSPNEKRDVAVSAQHAGGVWAVAIYDMAQDVGEKRGSQVALLRGDLLPKGYTRETSVYVDGKGPETEPATDTDSSAVASDRSRCDPQTSRGGRR